MGIGNQEENEKKSENGNKGESPKIMHIQVNLIVHVPPSEFVFNISLIEK